MFPKLKENNKVKKELAKFEKEIKSIQNIHVRNNATNLLKDLKNEYEIIDNSFEGTNGPVTPGIARESVINTIELRRKLTNLLKT
jgi:hypothetical protein